MRTRRLQLPASKPIPPQGLSRPCRRSSLAGLVSGLLLLGCLTSEPVPLAAAESTATLFEEHEVVIGSARRQTVLTGFLLGGETADLVAVEADEKGDRRIRIFAFDGSSWSPVVEGLLRPGVLSIDLANIGGSDRLITYERGWLSWFDPETSTERELLRIAWSYKALEGAAIARVDITRDLNGDGRDDLLLPDVDGFWVSLQTADGSFTEALKLGPPEPFRHERVGGLDTGDGVSEASRTYGDAGITAVTLPLYLSRVHEMDYDQDGRGDLVFWRDDHFEVHLQDEKGRFSPQAVDFAPGVPFDSEGTYSHAFEFRDRGFPSAVLGFGRKTERTVLHSLHDLDGDRVADLVTLTFSGRSITRQRGVYAVHFGTATADTTVFARDAGAVIRPRGRAGAMQPWGYASRRLEDLDGDGQADALFTDVNVGISGMMQALVGNSVPINLEIYRMENGVYPEKPSTRRKIRRFAPFAGLGNVFFPPVLMGDVSGDGREDLLVGKSPNELQVFLGVPGSEFLVREPRTVAVALPPDERNTWLADLNRDGKQDVLIHHTPTERLPNEPQRLTVLIAR